MRYYIIAGEASGDLHGSRLVKHLRKGDSNADIRAWGGDLMAAEGAQVVKHYRDLAFMGFAEVVANLLTIKRNFDFCEKDILAYHPDVLILIDYPGFNLRIAKFAKKKGFKVFYYISPQIWAWKQNRVHQVKAFVDEMYVILPFEKAFYAKFGVDVHYVGHPLVDAIEEYTPAYHSASAFRQAHRLDDRPIIALLPGSRRQEIKRMLPVMLQSASLLHGFQPVIAVAPSLPLDFYESMTGSYKVGMVSGATYELLHHSRAALVTSGTATLETALFKVPQVVCYKGGSLSYWIARALIKVKYISLVNLIMDKLVVREMIQTDMEARKLTAALQPLLDDTPQRAAMLAEYEHLHHKLGGGGASQRTALAMLKSLGIAE